jgi:hypothetical protein
MEHGYLLWRKVTMEEVKSEGTRTPEGQSVRVHLSHLLEKDLWWKICHSGRKREVKGALTESHPKGKSNENLNHRLR